MLKIHKQQHYFLAWWLSFLEEAFQVIKVEGNSTIELQSHLLRWDSFKLFSEHIEFLLTGSLLLLLMAHAVRYWHITEQNEKRGSICRNFLFFCTKLNHHCDSTLYLQKPFSPCCLHRLWFQSQLNTTWRWLWVSVATYTAGSSRPSP